MRDTMAAGFENLISVILALLFIGGPAGAAASKLPANLLISPEASPHSVILVEKASQRLFVYQFDGDYRLVATYPCATGENSGDKQISGDRKTPEGVYFFTKAVGEKYLNPTYGARAFPMNYPNIIDQRQRKQGNGIWVHGTNEELKERSTNGCIVLTNGDVVQLDPYIRLWDTPIIIEERLRYEGRDKLRHAGSFLFERIEDWSRAWSEKDLDRYLSYYAGHFRWKNLDLQAWRKRKASLNQRYQMISVQLDDIRLLRQGEVVLATAEETYRSDRFASHGFKHLYLVQNSSDWRILAEEWHRSNRPTPPTLDLAAKAQADSREAIGEERHRSNRPTPPTLQQVAEPPVDSKEAEESVRLFVEKWRLAWEQGDLSSYMACYHPRFRAEGMGLKSWRGYKNGLFHRSPKRAIQLSEITADLKDSTARVVAKQVYRSETYQDSGLKTLHLRWHRGDWAIYRETWQPRPDRG